MAKKIFNKRVIAFLMTVVMLFNGFRIGVTAAQGKVPELVENFADTYYKQDGTAGTASDWEIHLSKTAAPTDKDNIYNITLKVETKDTTIQTAGSTNGAAVLVLDVSNSMNTKEPGCTVCGQNQNAAIHCTKFEQSKKFWKDECKECGETKAAHEAHHKYQQSSKTQLQSLQAAVGSFLDAFVKDAAAGEKRMVAVAVFGTDAVTVQGWVDVTNAAALSSLKAKINSLSTGNGAYLDGTYLCNGGTNMEAGLVLGRNLLKDTTALAGIPITNQSLILFSDGEPTAAVGNVNSTSTEKVAYNNGDTGRSTDAIDYDDITNILKDVSAAKIAVKYNYNDNSGVLKIPPFTRVISSGASTLSVDLTAEAGKVITNKTNASTVTDPMGEGVSMISVTTGYNANTEKWDLSKFTPTVSKGITTYTITYQVEIDPETVELDDSYPGYTLLTPANGATTLNYTYGEQGTPVNADFNEPNIRGIRAFTVSYDYVGDVPAGAPQVPADKTYKAGATVQVADAPTLENYTFSGWSKTDFVMPAEDVVIVGSWTENPKYDYSLTYDANFGENETKADAENVSGTYATAHSITVDANSFVRENYTFVGWNTERDGSGKDYAADNTVALTAANNTQILYAQWIENTKYAYGLIYDANFGENETKADEENVINTYATAYSVTVDANSFIRENYTFVGWNTERDGSGKAYAPGEAVALTAEDNIEILYAQWTENPKYDYSVIYNANFGENMTKADEENVSGTYATAYSITVNENSFVRANYTFAGWNTAADGSGKAYAPGEAVALTAEDNMEILYAQWIEHPKYAYTLVYNANFGANETKPDAENISDTYATSRNFGVDGSKFIRANHTFIGWNTAADGSGIAYAPADVITLTAQNNTKILYAQWVEHPKYDYSVTYNANFGENEIKADAENISGIYATAHNVGVDANSFVRPNFTFTGWNTEADGSGKAYAAGETIALTAQDNTEILYAQWIENPKYDYSVIYNANFGENETKADAENISGTYAAAYSITVDANSFVRPNFTFTGWNTEADGSGKAYAVGETIRLTAQHNTEILYAQWIENPKYDYSVIYNANFGANETKSDAENVIGTYASEYTIGVDENTFIRENYTFIGWSTEADGEVVYKAGDSIHFVQGGEEVLYAKWIEHSKYSYTVIYNGNGGTLEDGSLAYGDSQNLAETYETSYNVDVDTNSFIRPNYTFVGWNTEADGSGRAYAADEVIALTAQNNTETLYAQWIENPKYGYSVIYNANFGENETKADAENISGIYATAYNIGVDANGFTRPGYTFVGWNTEADGSGKVYAAGETVALTAQDNTEILYAQWQINEYSYTVNYWVRVNGNAYALFSGDLSGAPTGGVAAFGIVIDQAHLEAMGLPATLTDAEYTYNFNAFEGTTIVEGENVVNVYYTCIVEEVVEIPEEDVPMSDIPAVEIPEEDVPLDQLPKTGDPVFVYLGSAVASAAGLICLLLGKKKEETEE